MKTPISLRAAIRRALNDDRGHMRLPRPLLEKGDGGSNGDGGNPPAVTPWFQGLSSEKIADGIEAKNKEIGSIFETHGDSLETLKADDARKVRDLNRQIDDALPRYDELAGLKNAKDRAAKQAQRIADGKGKDIARLDIVDPSDGDGDGDGKGRKAAPTDLASAFIEGKAWDHWQKAGAGSESEEHTSIGNIDAVYPGLKMINAKATLGSDDTLADVDSELPPESVRVGVVVDQRFQEPNIAQLMANATTTQPAVPYLRETVTSEGAVETNEGALFPEADISFTEDSSPVRKVPVMLPVTEEILSDEDFIRAHINARLPRFIRNREDLQLLVGDGVAPNLQGIIGTTGVQVQAQAIDDLEVAIYKANDLVGNAFSEVDSTVMHRTTWQPIRLRRTTDGIYILGDPTMVGPSSLWGNRVVLNNRMAVDAGGNENVVLTGAFGEDTTLFRRSGIEVLVSDSHEDNFGRDILTIKARTRVALVVWRPAGFSVVTAA